MEKENSIAHSIVDEFRQIVADVSNTPQSVGMELRIQFSCLLGELLKQKDWSQADLARATGINPPEISEYMHADANITVDQMGRILHAFGMRGRLCMLPCVIEVEPSPTPVASTVNVSASPTYKASTDGEKIIAASSLSSSVYPVRIA